MSDYFELKMHLGNAAMLTTGDVARELRHVAGLLDGNDFPTTCTGIIRDVNGNTVGNWSLELPGDDLGLPLSMYETYAI